MSFKSATLRKILRAHSFEPGDIEEVATGKFNSTFTVEVKDAPPGVEKDRVVLRIAPADDSGFIFYEEDMMAREPVIHDTVRAHTRLPVPAIYCFDDRRLDLDRSFLIMEYMPGTPLSEASLAGEGRQTTLEITGRYLRMLHDSCTGSRFGYPAGKEKKPRFTNWPEAFFAIWDRLIFDIEDCGVYSTVEADLARDALQSYAGVFPARKQASLLHMDIWGQNILVNSQGEVTAVLDWDRALWGDPEIEFAVLDYCGFNDPHFWRGYGGSPPQGEEAEIRARFYHLYEVQKYLVIWKLRGGQPSRITRYKNYALSILKDERKPR